MRYLILSDIHANMAAFEAVLAQAQGQYDQVISLGDVVGYGPEPNEALDRLRALAPAASIRGNHDKACCGLTDASDFNAVARAATRWTLERLRPDNLEYLKALPMGPAELANFQIVHGSLRDEDEYLFRAPEAQASLGVSTLPLTFFGHTHMQGGFILHTDGSLELLRLTLPPGASSGLLALEDGRYLLNPGSVGQPRDADPRAAYLLYDDEAAEVSFGRVPYAIADTQQKMKVASLHGSLIARLALGR